LNRQALEAGLEPSTIITEGLAPGMNVVREKVQTGAGQRDVPVDSRDAAPLPDACDALRQELLRFRQFVTFPRQFSQPYRRFAGADERGAPSRRVSAGRT